MKPRSEQYYTRVVKILLPFVRRFFRRRSDWAELPPPELPKQFFLVFNHTTNLDGPLLICATGRQFHFIATETVVFNGLGGRLLQRLFDPVPLSKGGQTFGSVREIVRRIQAGQSLALAPEGNTSWDGRTAPFPPATGKLIRSLGVPLVTYRIRGGYYSDPRWAYSHRKGPLSAELVHIYPPEELKAMTPEQIQARMAEDLQEDACKTLRSQNASYRGKKLAEGMEHALVVCPSCGAIGTLKGRGNTFSCPCGFHGSMDEKGVLSLSSMPAGMAAASCPAADAPPAVTVPDWEDWQKAFIARLSPDSEAELASDPQLKLMRVENHRRRELLRGRVSMTPQALRAGDRVFPLSEIRALEVSLKGSVSFSLKDGSYFELLPLRKKDDYSGRKYKLLFDRFSGE